jgi:uncharacterized delta-60 repeat protein
VFVTIFLRCKPLLVLALCCGFSATLATLALAASGGRDPNFSGDGKVSTNFGNRDDFANGVAIQADGKIVVAGRAGGGGGRFGLARYNPNGTLDTSFGSDGKVVTNFSASADDFANGVAIQADGKIVAAGHSSDRFALVRYNTDGKLDLTFSGDGKVTTNFSADFDDALGVAIQADGMIVAAGHAGFGRFALARYNPDGTPDTTFSDNGKVTTNFSRASDLATGVAIQANGKIVAAGTAGSTEFSGKFALARYNANGTLDTTFSGNGKATTDFTPGEQDVAFGVAIQANGKIVAAGGGDVGGIRFALARYTRNGALDTTFSGDGKVTTDFSAGLDAAHGVAIQADGKIVAAGHADFHRFALARYNRNGNLDTTFTGNGKVVTNFTRRDGFEDDFANGVAIQADGKIVAVGRAGGSSGRFALARYLG